MKQVDTREYIGVLRELTEEGRQVSLIIAGNSMAPFLIHGRDTVWFEKPKRALKKGDIVFFQRDDGSFILHRIRRVYRNTLPKNQKGENGYPPDIRNTYDIIGDAQLETECGIRRDQIFSIVFRVERKGRIIEPGDFWWLFLSGCGFGSSRSGHSSECFMEQCSPERDRHFLFNGRCPYAVSHAEWPAVFSL